jgi:hypothetical protein
MARNKISDLRDHLFAALERIDNDDLTADQISQEVNKAKAIASIGSVLINSAKVEMEYIKATGKLDTASELFKSINDPKQLQ